MVMPGMINIHSHPTSEPLRKGITDEIRSPGFYHSSLYEFLTIFENDPERLAASVRVAMAELLKSGVTTVVVFSAPFDRSEARRVGKEGVSKVRSRCSQDH